MRGSKSAKLSRRGFFASLSTASGAERPASGRSRDASGESAEPPAEGRTQFSLDEFYAARGPQKLPPIAIRPSVLQHAVETTRVGLAPAHDAPDLGGEPLYAELASQRGEQRGEEHADGRPATDPAEEDVPRPKRRRDA